MNLKYLVDELNVLLKLIEGDVSICFKNLNTNEVFSFNENEQYNTASLMKVVVGLEFLLSIERGDIAEDYKVELKNSFRSKVDDSYFGLSVQNDNEKELYAKIGTRVSVMELLELMITKSSNLATNNLFDLINNNSTSQLLDGLKMHNTQVVRGVEDQKAYDAGIINFTTASDILKLFDCINNGVVAGNRHINRLYEILKRQEDNTIIPRLLPKKIDIAHKTGSIKSVRHDAALISGENGVRYILVILSKNLIDTKKSISQLAKISEIFYKYVVTTEPMNV